MASPRNLTGEIIKSEIDGPIVVFGLFIEKKLHYVEYPQLNPYLTDF